MSEPFDVQCVLCHVALSQSVYLLQCNHLICGCCFQALLTNSSTQLCPLDGIETTIEKAFHYSTLQEYTNSLMVGCTNCFCQWRGFTFQLKNHLEECLFQLVDCPYDECTTRLTRSLMSQHQAGCQHQPVKCQNCCHFYYKKDEESHKTLCVANVTMTCKNPGCNVIFPCTMKRRHYKVCDYEQVSCQNYQCSKLMIRKELAEHTKMCLNQTLICENCHLVFTRKEMLDHQDECSEKEVICEAPSCKTKVLRKDLEEHLNECCHIKIDCPSENCMNRFRRSYLEKHLESCAHVLVTCKFCGEVCKRHEVGMHGLVCSKQMVLCLYGCNERVERGQLHEHINKCTAAVMEACRYSGCQFKGSKSDCRKHEENCPFNVDKENVLEWQTFADTLDLSFKSASNSLRKDSIIDTVMQVEENTNTDNLNTVNNENQFSFGRIVWEYETEGIKIADEAIGEGALPETPSTPVFDDTNFETKTTQLECTPMKQSLENSIRKSSKSPKYERSLITPYKKVRPRKHSSPLSVSIDNKNNAPNAFIGNWKEFDELKSHVLLQEQEIVRLKQSSYKIQSTVEQLEKEKSLLCTELRLLRNNSQGFITNKVVWEIDRFSCRLDVSYNEGRMVECNSPAFYNSAPGYKCMAMAYVYKQSNGFEGLQLGFTILKGKYDSILSWPFQKQINVSILSKKNGYTCNEKLLLVVDELSPECCGQPMEFDNDQQIIGFVTHDELREYISDDTLVLQCGIYEKRYDNENLEFGKYKERSYQPYRNHTNRRYIHKRR